jgi:hypothetical protein
MPLSSFYALVTLCLFGRVALLNDPQYTWTELIDLGGMGLPKAAFQIVVGVESLSSRIRLYETGQIFAEILHLIFGIRAHAWDPRPRTRHNSKQAYIYSHRERGVGIQLA